MHKRYGGPFWRKISIPLILHGVRHPPLASRTRADDSGMQSIAPPQRPTNIIIPGFLVSFASQFWALRYRTRWFEKVRLFPSRWEAG